jgi:hypothetical protein
MHVLTALALAALPVHPGPAHFVRAVDNPWFPLRPGTTFIYRGTQEGDPVRDTVRVLRRTRRIQGVRCTAVRDQVYVRGRLAERTTDYYAQDDRGTVWYFGERTAELDANGHVTSTEGSWRSGLHGARAGIFMPAHPRVGRTFQQEFLRGHAEDRFTITSRRARVATPYVTTNRALRTREFTPLEPGIFDGKLYVYGIGNVAEQSLTGPNEALQLVEVLAPR